MDRESRTPSIACDPQWVRALALRAGGMLEEAVRDRSGLRVDRKGAVDLVTETDLAVQQMLVGELRRSFPDDRVVAEEGDLSARADTRGAVWYVDPLDGTTNFVHGYPFYCVSIARWVDGAPEVGVVHAPELDELYLARRDEGATLERPGRGAVPRRLDGGVGPGLDDALLATGFPYARGATATLNLALCARALSRARGLRRAGSAALDLCHVAAGRLDGYWEMGLSPWDLAAAVLVAREASVRATDFEGRDEVLEARRLVAARPPLHAELLGMIAATHDDPDPSYLGRLPEGSLPLTGPLPGDPA